jgi:hypothetical protein
MISGQFYPGQPIQFESELPFRNPWHLTTMFETIQRLGLTGNLELCLDAGDGSSYTSGQPWLDRSGNGFDFNRGATSGAEASDPTFNGSADARTLSEYFSFDGGDYFTYDTTNETWMENLHKDSALFTIVSWVYVATAAANRPIFGNNNANAVLANGVALFVGAADIVTFLCDKTGAICLNVSSSNTINEGAWNFISVSIDEAATTGFFRVNDTVTTFTSTYNVPTASNAANTTQIGAFGNNGAPLVSGCRIAELAAWEGTALTQAQVQNIHTATRGRFGV